MHIWKNPLADPSLIESAAVETSWELIADIGRIQSHCEEVWFKFSSTTYTGCRHWGSIIFARKFSSSCSSSGSSSQCLVSWMGDDEVNEETSGAVRVVWWHKKTARYTTRLFRQQQNSFSPIFMSRLENDKQSVSSCWEEQKRRRRRCPIHQLMLTENKVDQAPDKDINGQCKAYHVVLNKPDVGYHSLFRNACTDTLNGRLDTWNDLQQASSKESMTILDALLDRI